MNFPDLLIALGIVSLFAGGIVLGVGIGTAIERRRWHSEANNVPTLFPNNQP